MNATDPADPSGPPARSQESVSRRQSLLLLIDVQEKLLPVIDRGPRIVWNSRRLLEGAMALQVPAAATEQYPEGLGPTTPEIASRVEARFPKRTFSCRECTELWSMLEARRVDQVVLAGLETHVCVQQSALDLLADGYRVFVVADAVGSRRPLDHRTGLRRMESCGAVVTTTESVLFEWCETSADPQFKRISRLIREEPVEGDDG